MAKIERNTNAGWVKPICLETNRNLSKIINFFLLNTPCDNTSSMGIPLSSYGWDKKTYNLLFRALMECACLAKGETYQLAYSIDEMSDANNNVGFNKHFNQKRDINRLVFFHDRKKNLVHNLLFYVRSSFAHGRFAIYDDSDKNVYALETIKNNSSRFMAVLTEEALLKWIVIIKDGPVKLQELKKDNIEDYKTRIIELMTESTSKITKQYIQSTLRIQQSMLNKIIKEMKSENIVVYSNTKKQWELVNGK